MNNNHIQKTKVVAYEDYRRFQMDLEFVQLLGNPDYLHQLAMDKYFEDQRFINYLEYLLYWKQPEYIKYLNFPLCLRILECLQDKQFRMKLFNLSEIEDLKKEIQISFDEILQNFDINFPSVQQNHQFQSNDVQIL